MRNAARLVCTFIVIGTFLGACGGSTKPKASVETGDEWKPTTVQEQLLAETTDEGVLPKDAALQLFALQYGPLPGVTVPKGDAGPSTDGNLAIASVATYWRELTAEQQAQIREYLELPDFEPQAPGTSTTVPEGGPGKARRSDVAPYRASLDLVVPALAARFGPLGVPIEVTTSTAVVRTSRGDAPALADAIVSGGQCRIRVFPAQFPPPTGPTVTLIHELFHCYQQRWVGDVLPTARNWVQEGGAEWIGMTVGSEIGAPIDQVLRSNFIEYFATPTRPLFRRAYDAVGFLAYAQQAGVDVMARIRDVTVARSNTAAFAALGLPLNDTTKAEWATTQTEIQRFGARWYLRGTGVPDIVRTIPLVYSAVPNGRSASGSAPGYATTRLLANLSAEITTIEATGVGYAHNGSQERPLTELTAQPWCTGPDSPCVCPPDTRQAGREFPRLQGGETVLVAGAGTSGSSITVSGRSLRDICGEEPKCPVGTWRMDQAPTGLPFTFSSGGYGKVLTIQPDGSFVQSFDEYVTAQGSLRDATFEVSASGRITGRVVIPAGVALPTDMQLQDLDASGLTGTLRLTVSGTTTEITGPEFTEVASGLVTADPRRTARLNCVANGTLTATAGGATETYRMI